MKGEEVKDEEERKASLDRELKEKRLLGPSLEVWMLSCSRRALRAYAYL